MNYQPAASNGGNVFVPPGWKAEWSVEHARYFYVNLSTAESTWTLPSTPQQQHVQQPVQQQPIQQPMQQQCMQQQQPIQQIQRKPVSSQAPQTTGMNQGIATTKAYTENYPTPPPQISTGYFPPAPNAAQQNVQNTHQYPSQYPQTQQPQYQQSQQQLYQQPQQQSQFQYPPPPQHITQQSYKMPPTPAPQFSPPPAAQYPNYTPNTAQNGIRGQPAPAAFQNPQSQQAFSPPPTPEAYKHQQPYTYPVPAQNLQQGQTPPAAFSNVTSPTPSQANGAYYPQPANNHSQQPPQFQQPQQVHRGNSYPNPTQPQSQYPMQQPQYQAQPQAQFQPPQPQHQAPPSHRTSMMGGSLVGGSMMNRMSSKFSSLQKGMSGPPTPAGTPGAKGPTDWKKWAKRGAIGVAGIGALALGVDAAGDMFSGAEGMAGGGDFSGGGGDFSGGGDPGAITDAQIAMSEQQMVDASNAQLAMAEIGQSNSQMLLDPVGTEYTMVSTTSTGNPALDLI